MNAHYGTSPSYAELLKQQQQIQEQLAEAKQREAAHAFETVRSYVSEFSDNFTDEQKLELIKSLRIKKTRTKSVAKFIIDGVPRAGQSKEVRDYRAKHKKDPDLNPEWGGGSTKVTKGSAKPISNKK
ncbi:TPA: hypothetical protein ACOENT_001774 [Stenotrophomonas maltophilia]